MLKLCMTKRACKFVETLPPKQFKQVMRAVLGLMSNPTPNDSKKLIGYNYLRQDVGEYRIVYQHDDETLVVALIGKRNDDEVYKKLSRMNSPS